LVAKQPFVEATKVVTADTKDTVVGSLTTEGGTITFDTSDPSQSATIAEIKVAAAQYR
jgi:hypothetical protein